MEHIDTYRDMENVKESCAVCWRDFSSTVKPYSLSCGHSYCYDCSILLKKCPLCRSRLAHNASRPTNYALLSLIEKTEQVRPPDTKHMSIQTEEQPSTDIRRTRNTSTSDPIALGNTRVKKKEALRFKFTRGATGMLEGLEILI